jgi:hypothetical protein
MVNSHRSILIIWASLDELLFRVVYLFLTVNLGSYAHLYADLPRLLAEDVFQKGVVKFEGIISEGSKLGRSLYLNKSVTMS